MVDSEQFWSPVPVFILFRESIEASIIVAVLLQFLNRSGPWLKKQVWLGVFLGAAVSICIAVIFIAIYYAAKNNIFQGKNQFIFNGAVGLFASVLIGWMAFIMLRFIGWERKWERKLVAAADKAQSEEAMALAKLDATKAEGGGVVTIESAEVVEQKSLWRKIVGCGTEPDPAVVMDPNIVKPNKPLWRKIFMCESENEIENYLSKPPSKLDVWFQTKVLRKPLLAAKSEEAQLEEATKLARMKAAHDMLPARQRYTIFLLAFITVVREGLEVVVFMAGVGNSNASAIPLSGAVGILCGVVVGAILYYTGKTVENVKWLMIIMATFLFFIGAGQALNGGHNLMLGSSFGTYITPGGIPYPTVYQSAGLLPFGMDPLDTAGAAAGGGFSDGDEVVVVFGTVFNDLYIKPTIQEQPWWQGKLWDISNCCSNEDTKNRFLALMSKILGYTPTPCFIDAVFYCGYWVIVLVAMMWKLWGGTLLDADYKHTRMLKKKAKEAALEREAAELAAPTKVLELAASNPDQSAKHSLDSSAPTHSSSHADQSEPSPSKQ